MEKSEWEIAWSDYLSVGVVEMDEEHRRFITRVNDLNQAVIEAEGKATVVSLMESMLMEATHHFSHEQELLAHWNYPDVDAHSATHAVLASEFDRVMKEIEATDISFVWALKGLRLKQLLVDHLLKEDMKYRDFLRAQTGQ